MGGSYQDALEVPVEVMNRYFDFADIEEQLKQVRAENAEPQQQ